jgi:hypothetical protein
MLLATFWQQLDNTAAVAAEAAHGVLAWPATQTGHDEGVAAYFNLAKSLGATCSATAGTRQSTCHMSHVCDGLLRALHTNKQPLHTSGIADS